jgi:hypothetical protein
MKIFLAAALSLAALLPSCGSAPKEPGMREKIETLIESVQEIPRRLTLTEEGHMRAKGETNAPEAAAGDKTRPAEPLPAEGEA